MPNGELPRAVVLTIIKNGSHEWIIEPADKRKMGPYHSATMALKVAALEVLSARKRGLKADIFVRDDYGSAHLCALIDRPDDTDRCVTCESSWLTVSRPLEPRCPLWEAFCVR